MKVMPAERDDAQHSISFATLFRRAAEQMEAAGIESPQVEAAILLAHLCNCSRSQLRLKAPEPAPRDIVGRLEAALRRRLNHEPLAYIIGTQEFMGLVLHVDKRVLIPRPETEILVEAVCERLAGSHGPVIADIGCGCGNIAIALASALPDAILHATDISPEALQVAGLNVTEHRLSSRVLLHCGDLFEPLQSLHLEGKLTAVVSNPPYVADDEIAQLQPEIKHFEPDIALRAGPDGMAFHRRIIAGSRSFLVPGGLLALEVGIKQAHVVAQHMQAQGYADVQTLADLNRIERVVMGRWSS